MDRVGRASATGYCREERVFEIRLEGEVAIQFLQATHRNRRLSARHREGSGFVSAVWNRHRCSSFEAVRTERTLAKATIDVNNV
jgi:hypothetical protein